MEAQANAGTCGPNSAIGETIVVAGVGNDPYMVTGGKVYLTGPYEGAPFSLVSVTSAVVGPFNLGNVVGRATIYINPYTTQATDTSGPFPRIIDGVPLQIKHVNKNINRPGFTFNPTHCNRLLRITSNDLKQHEERQEARKDASPFQVGAARASRSNRRSRRRLRVRRVKRMVLACM